MLTIIYKLLDKIILFMEFAIILDALLSWIIVDPFNKYRRAVSTIVNPILNPIRDRMRGYLRIAFIDFSPLIAIFLLEICRVLLRLLFAILI